MYLLWYKPTDETTWKRGYITPNRELPSDKKYEKELRELGHDVKWQELRELDYQH